MESRVFFPLKRGDAYPSLKDEETMTRFLAATNSPQDANNFAPKLVTTFCCGFTEERNDLYLVLPPPSGMFVGIKYRALDTAAGREKKSDRLAALWAQKVEVKVTPISTDDMSLAPSSLQHWTKVKRKLPPRVEKRSDPMESQFFSALRQCLLSLAQEPLKPGIVRSLEAAAKALQPETPDNSFFPRFVSVFKSRVKEAVLGGAIMEETDLILRDVTSQFLTNSTSNENNPEDLHFRTWCMEDLDSTQALRDFAVKSCPAALANKTHHSTASYPQFLTKMFFPSPAADL